MHTPLMHRLELKNRRFYCAIRPISAFVNCRLSSLNVGYKRYNAGAIVDYDIGMRQYQLPLYWQLSCSLLRYERHILEMSQRNIAEFETPSRSS